MAGRTRAHPESDEPKVSTGGRAWSQPTMRIKSSPAQRISIIGATGSGKSVLARRLSEELRLPLYELDTLFWDGQGRGRPQREFVEAVSELAKRDSWVLDGHYRVVRDLIWRRSDMVVWLNYPLWLVGFRLLRRFAQKRRAASKHGASGSDDRKEPHEVPGQGSVTWRDRMGRLTRTVRERGEYGRLLKGPEYRGVEVVELRSLRETKDLVRRANPPRERAGSA